MPTVTRPSQNAPVQRTTGTTSANGLKNGRFAGDATLENVAAGRATIGNGAKGPTVKKVQQALLDMGFALKQYPSKTTGKPVAGVDGEFGAQSRNALLNFQRHAVKFFPDVKQTGTLDQATLKALDALAPAPGNKAWAPAEKPKTPVPYFNGVPVRIVVVKDEHRTYLFDKNGKVQGIFANAIGAKGHSTETGLKVVRTRLDQKASEATGKALWNNPKVFGPRIIDLSWADGRTSGEELHGTATPHEQGLDVSKGCVRHYNDDIVTMFDSIAVGEKVAIVESLNDPRLKK
ncbi:MAG: L,D-transpeptidase family protein [Myxococcales bacterium]